MQESTAADGKDPETVTSQASSAASQTGRDTKDKGMQSAVQADKVSAQQKQSEGGENESPKPVSSLETHAQSQQFTAHRQELKPEKETDVHAEPSEQPATAGLHLLACARAGNPILDPCVQVPTEGS